MMKGRRDEQTGGQAIYSVDDGGSTAKRGSHSGSHRGEGRLLVSENLSTSIELLPYPLREINIQNI